MRPISQPGLLPSSRGGARGFLTVRFAVAVVACLALFMSACGDGSSDGGDDVCDGVPAAMGGCENDQPVFTGDDCPTLAREAVEQLEQRITAIHAGPEDGELTKASRAFEQTRLVIVGRLNSYLRDNDIPCFADDLWPLMEQQFSDEFREVAPLYLYDWEVAGDDRPTWNEWTAEFRSDALRSLDLER